MSENEKRIKQPDKIVDTDEIIKIIKLLKLSKSRRTRTKHTHFISSAY